MDLYPKTKIIYVSVVGGSMASLGFDNTLDDLLSEEQDINADMNNLDFSKLGNLNDEQQSPPFDNDNSVRTRNNMAQLLSSPSTSSTKKSTTPHETTEHNSHHAQILALRSTWTHPRPRCTKTPTSSYRKIHFVRHGQGTHNLLAAQKGGCSCTNGDPTKCPYKDEAVADAYLTPLGREQAAKNQSFTKTLSNIQVIYVSPLSRAIETAQIAFKDCLERDQKVPFIANENLREQIGSHCCDRRRSMNIIQREYPEIDFSQLTSNDDVLWSEERESKLGVALRAKAFFDMLHVVHHVSNNSENNTGEIAVVGHSSHLLTMMNVTLDCGEENDLESWFETGELRTVWVDI